MQCFTVSPLPGTQVKMDVCLRSKVYEHVDHSRRPCVLIFPGGGYTHLSPREAEPIAVAFVQAGYQACVLHYSVRPSQDAPALGDTPLQEAAAAVRYIREHSEDWGIDPNKITVCGFSAGGHLAGCLGVLGSNEGRIPGASDGKCQPNAMILSYAPAVSELKASSGSFVNTSGYDSVCPERDPWSIEKHIGPSTCPAFIWHTTEDPVVPVENALLLSLALQKAKIPYDLHIYTKGAHGLSLANEHVRRSNPHAATWLSLALQWLNVMGVGPGY